MLYYDLKPGCTIQFGIEEAMKLAQKKRDDVIFVCNGTPVIIRPDITREDIPMIIEQYSRAVCKACIWQPFTVFVGKKVS